MRELPQSFICSICDMETFTFPRNDPIDVCMMCRTFCGFERRWYGNNNPQRWQWRPPREATH